MIGEKYVKFFWIRFYPNGYNGGISTFSIGNNSIKKKNTKSDLNRPVILTNSYTVYTNFL